MCMQPHDVVFRLELQERALGVGEHVRHGVKAVPEVGRVHADGLLAHGALVGVPGAWLWPEKGMLPATTPIMVLGSIWRCV